MRLLVDQNLPPRLARLLAETGHDAVHVRDVGLAAATDPQIFEHAVTDERIIVSADTDFGALLAHHRATRPSVILVRSVMHLAPTELAARLAAQLPDLQEDLLSGAVAALTPKGRGSVGSSCGDQPGTDSSGCIHTRCHADPGQPLSRDLSVVPSVFLLPAVR